MMAEFGGEGLKARAQTRIISEPLFLPQFKVLPKLATNFAQQPCYIKEAPAQNSYFKELIAVCVWREVIIRHATMQFRGSHYYNPCKASSVELLENLTKGLKLFETFNFLRQYSAGI